jgi:hypothetical protein
MERVTEATTTDFFICGPGKFVIMRKEGTNALQLSIRDTSGRIPNQIFIKSTMPNPSGSGNCIVFQAKDSNGLYVQYEHEHISLRPLNADGKPFMGQCFTEYNVSNAELEANALALGVSAARLGNEELYGAGYDNTIAVPPGAEGALADSGDELASAADKRTEDALSSITGTLNELKQKLGGTQPTQSVFGTGGPIQINLDVAGLEDDNDKATFQDLAVGSGTASVRELLDQYTNMSDSLQLINDQIKHLQNKLIYLEKPECIKSLSKQIIEDERRYTTNRFKLLINKRHKLLKMDYETSSEEDNK